MDNLDYQILTELKKNARQTASDISKSIHLSVSTVIERIKKMEKSGLIQSYTVITDDSKLGNDITVLMEIGMEHPRFNDEFIEHINRDPNIIACYYLTGEFDFMLKICCQSSDHLEQIHNRIKDYPGVRLTRTHYVLRTVKNIHSSGFDSLRLTGKSSYSRKESPKSQQGEKKGEPRAQKPSAEPSSE